MFGASGYKVLSSDYISAQNVNFIDNGEIPIDSIKCVICIDNKYITGISTIAGESGINARLSIYLNLNGLKFDCIYASASRLHTGISTKFIRKDDGNKFYMTSTSSDTFNTNNGVTALFLY